MGGGGYESMIKCRNVFFFFGRDWCVLDGGFWGWESGLRK